MIQEKITFYVNNKIEESVKLAFKSAKDLIPFDGRNKSNFTKLISSFANTSGGKVVYGIETKRKKASKLEFIDSNKISKQELEFCIKHEINREIKNINIDIIEFENIKEQTIITINIPESNDAPHMISDNKYYKRVQLKEVVMEEKEIREMYLKSVNTNLDFYAITNTNGVPKLEKGKFKSIDFFPRFLIHNVGNTVEKYYKFEYHIPASLNDSSFGLLQKYFNRYEGNRLVYLISNKDPLFQEEITSIIETKLTVNKQNFHTFEQENIILKLFYTNGVKTQTINLIDTFLYKNSNLKIFDFI